MSASLSWISGKAMAAAAITSENICSRRARDIRAKGRARSEPVAASSGFVRGDAAEQAGRTEHQDQYENREDDYIGPGIGDELAAHCLDQADDDAAKHGAGNVAYTAQHRGGERTQSGGETDNEA